MLGGVEEFVVEPGGLAVRPVGAVGAGVPKRVILAGIADVPGVADPEGIAALEVPEVAGGVGEDDAVIADGFQIRAQGVLEQSGHTALRRRDGQNDVAGRLVHIGLRIAEVVFLAEGGRRGDLPALLLLKGKGTIAHGDHDLLGIFQRAGAAVPSIEEEVLPVNLNDRARADPAVLAAAAGGLQHRFVILRVREEVRGRDEIGRVVVGIAGLFQVVDVVDAVLIVGHGVAHEGLAGPVHLREEEEIIVIGILLASRRAQARKVLVVSRLLDRVSRVLVPGSVERQVAFDFVRVGPGFGQILVLVPALKDIALAGADSFESFCDEFDYDIDSRKAEKIYKACKREYAKFERVSGFSDDEMYDFINELQEVAG